MRKILLLAIVIFFSSAIYSPASAHPGRTDSSGCHTCRTNCPSWGLSYGEYHCHNGGSSGVSNEPAAQSAPVQQQVIKAPAYTKVPTRIIIPTNKPTPIPIPTRIIVPTKTPTPTPTPYIETEMDKKKMFKVVRIIDGDTIEIFIREKYEKVRLLGIDTPETVDPRKPIQCFGKEASNKMKSLVTGKYIKLIDDRTQGNRDKYNRLLRYLYDGKVFINAEMVKQGYAFSYKQYPTKFLNDFNNYEKQAREKNLGLWKSCPAG